jgi:3-oxoacyl-[acyl-carrier-protein] synthase-3
MIFSRILATGTYLPKTILSNDDIAKRVDTSHEWILERTGIEARHIAEDFETTASMGACAARSALQIAQISTKEIDMVIVATCTPAKVFPSTACLIQQELGIPPGPAFDIQAACSGFIYGLSIVDQFIRSGIVKKALLIGSEVMSRVVDWQDRRTCVLFGDGAGAVLLEAALQPGVLSTYISADGRQKDILYLENHKEATIQMQGNSLFKLAVNMLGEVALKTLIENNLTVSDIDWLIPHQANIRIIQATAEKLGLPMERVIVTLGSQGNTSAASIPLALDAAIRQQKIQPGQHLLLEAFGGGLTWGTALIRY